MCVPINAASFAYWVGLICISMKKKKQLQFDFFICETRVM